MFTKNLRKTWAILIALALVLGVGGAIAEESTAGISLQGQWQATSEDILITFTFAKDGTFEVALEDGTVFESGAYISANDTLILFTPAEGIGACVVADGGEGVILASEIVAISEEGDVTFGEVMELTRVEGSEPEAPGIETTNALLGKWKAFITEEGQSADTYMTFTTDGIMTYSFNFDGEDYLGTGYYSVFGGNIIMYYPDYGEWEAFSFVEKEDGSLSVTKLIQVEPDSPPEPSDTAEFERVEE